MADSVQLTDLDVITRYSIAVRSASADRDELIETLRGDLAWLERGRSRSSVASTATYAEPVEAEDEAAEQIHEPEPAPAPRRTPVRRASTARKTAAKKTATRRTAR